MKKLFVKKIAVDSPDASVLSGLLEKENIPFNSIDCVNWEEYPYKPEVKFRIAYTDNSILLNYLVKENSLRADFIEDDGSVWNDSCVEFFIIPGQDDIYYNLEFNCIGTMLAGAGTGRDERERGELGLTKQVKRWSSLGNGPIPLYNGDFEWELSLVIPFTIFFKHTISSLQGKTVRANFYKCGDELTTPHFLSWNRICNESPNFHLPQFFGELKFEE